MMAKPYARKVFELPQELITSNIRAHHFSRSSDDQWCEGVCRGNHYKAKIGRYVRRNEVADCCDDRASHS